MEWGSDTHTAASVCSPCTATPGQRTPGSRVRAKPASAGSTGFASWLATQDDAESELPASLKGDDDGDGLGSEDYLEEDEGSVVGQVG